MCADRAPARAALISAALLLSAASLQAQPLTLEDLAALQRQAIENEARRAVQRPDAAGGSPTVPAPAIPIIANPASPPTQRHPAAAATPPPRWTVAGIAGARDRWIVELLTDQGPHTLRVGDLVPGTGWRVTQVSARAVRIERSANAHAGRRPRTEQRLLEPGTVAAPSP